MCLENSLCFWIIVAGTSVFNFLVYHIVSLAMDIASTNTFSPEKYANTTLVTTSDKMVSRFKRWHTKELETHNIKIVKAECHLISVPEGRPVNVLIFKQEDERQLE